MDVAVRKIRVHGEAKNLSGGGIGLPERLCGILRIGRLPMHRHRIVNERSDTVPLQKRPKIVALMRAHHILVVDVRRLRANRGQLQLGTPEQARI